MAEKPHICSRMVEFIESKGLTVTDWEKEAMEANVKCSVGYLRKAAKNGTSIGFDLVEYFLSYFKDVDVHWLITGIHLRSITDKNSTPDIKNAASYDETYKTALQAILDKDNEIRKLREDLKNARKAKRPQQ